MTKKLFSQIRNEWRANLWLAAELLIVSVVLWIVVGMLYDKVGTYLEPRGFNTEHCYRIMLGELTDKSAGYQPYASQSERAADIRELLNRLSHRPEVEAASLSQNSYPYNGSNSGIQVSHDTLYTPQASYCVRRLVTPDFVRVFRYEGTRGETPEQLAQMLERGELLASDNLYQENHHLSLTSLIGKQFYLGDDTTKSYKLGASLIPVRYDDYIPANRSLTMVYDLNRCDEGFLDSYIECCVRVREDQDHDFITRLKADSEKQFRVGNIYIAEVYSFTDLRRVFLRSDTNQLRNYLTGCSFLLLNIFLGLLGTFWFRTLQRRGEIALHMVHGATRRQVFGRLVAEGVLILTIVTLPALVTDFLLAYFEVGLSLELGLDMLAICALITYLLILSMMFIGIGIPARKAMNIQPAEALHDE